MASTTWRIQGVDTGRADLVLSALELWGAVGRIDAGATLTCSHTPVAGTLDSLTDGDPLTKCTWAAADVFAPGFYIQWELPTAQDSWGVRASSPTKTGFPRSYELGFYDGLKWWSQQQGQVVWPGSGALSLQRETAPVFAYDIGWNNIFTARNVYGVAVSGDGLTQLYTESGAGSQGFLSTDGGITWNPALGLVAGSSGFGTGAASDDGSVIAVGGYGGSASKLNISTDRGATWSQPSVSFTTGVYTTAVSGDGNTILACDPTGASYISQNRGATWAALSAPKGSATGFSEAAASADGSKLLVSGYGSSAAQVSISKDSGATWTQVPGLSVSSSGFESCGMSDDAEVMIAVGAGLGSLRVNLSTNSGVSWAPVATVVASGGFAGCAVSGDGKNLVVCGYGASTDKVFMSKDRGVTWAAETAPVAGSTGFSRCAISSKGTVALVSAQSPRVAVRLARDGSYEELTLQIGATVSSLVVQGGAQTQELGPLVDIGATQIADTEFGGNGRVYGTVERKNTPANVPLRRRVRLHRSRDGMLVRETWSKANGSYEFKGISMQYEYDTIAWDNEMSYRSVVANNLKPEAM